MPLPPKNVTGLSGRVVTLSRRILECAVILIRVVEHWASARASEQEAYHAMTLEVAVSREALIEDHCRPAAACERLDCGMMGWSFGDRQIHHGTRPT